MSNKKKRKGIRSKQTRPETLKSESENNENNKNNAFTNQTLVS